MARTWVAALAALALACGSGGRSGTGTQSQGGSGDIVEGGGGIEGGGDAGGGNGGGGNGGGGTDGGAGQIGGKCEGQINLRVEAIDLGFFEALELDVNRIEFAMIGGGVTLTPAPGDLLVLRKDQPVLLAMLALPRDQIVDVTVFLDRVRACLPEHCLEMDPCFSPLRFRLDFWKVRDHCNVVLRIDVNDSVFADRERWAFVPRYALYY